MQYATAELENLLKINKYIHTYIYRSEILKAVLIDSK